MIKISNLNKYYNKGKSNEIHVINDTTITLNDTGLVCILGESGSGKTTLMNTISGLDDFYSGTIDVDGNEIKKFGEEKQEIVRNAKFGYIFQNYYLLQDRTVEYNIMLALSMYEISDEEKAARIDYVLKAVDMWRYKKRLISQLSGGQQQRIAIARALAKAPKVIFADEPTGNLDEANTMRIMGVLKKISKNCLVVVVTHEKSIADFFADRILWIADGKIEKEVEKESQGCYQYVEDTNLYLQEYEKATTDSKNITLEVYSNEENEALNIKVICENGKLYIHTDANPNVEILTNESEKKVIDSKKPVVEMTDVDDIDYELKQIDNAKKPKMTFAEIVDIAKTNMYAMGKKQIFLAFTLMIMSVMIVLSVQDIMALIHIDTQSIVTSDSHYYELKAKKNSLITDTEYKNLFSDITTTLQENGMDLYVVASTEVIFEYSGFVQLENTEFKINHYSLVNIEKISEEDLIYGEMPKSTNEVVMDEWVIEAFIGNSSEIGNIITDVKQVLGNTILINEKQFTICGISRTEQPDIYLDSDSLIMLTRNSIDFITQTKAQENYPNLTIDKTLTVTEDGKVQVLVSEPVLRNKYLNNLEKTYGSLARYYADMLTYEYMIENFDDSGQGRHPWGTSKEKLEENYQEAKENLKEKEQEYGITVEEYEAMLNDEEAYKSYTYTDSLISGAEYEVIGSYPSEYDIDFIIADDGCDVFAKAIMDMYKQCNIYMENTEEKSTEDVIAEIRSYISDDAKEKLTITIENNYENALEEYRAEQDEKSGAKILVTITIFVISMVILYFMMKANAIARMQDLGVYRMLGISKKSIIAMFACENFMITTYTSLVGVILTTAVTYVISQIPSLEMSIVFPWYAFVLVVIFLYAANILVGIMPIRKMLKLPPAQLAAKYDI